MKPVHEVSEGSVRPSGDGATGGHTHTPSAGGETFRASHRGRVEMLGSLSLLAACLLAGGVLTGCGADASLGTLGQEERGRGQVNNKVIVDWIVHTDEVTSPNTPSNTPPASRQAARSDKLPSISTRPR